MLIEIKAESVGFVIQALEARSRAMGSGTEAYRALKELVSDIREAVKAQTELNGRLAH